MSIRDTDNCVLKVKKDIKAIATCTGETVQLLRTLLSPEGTQNEQLWRDSHTESTRISRNRLASKDLTLYKRTKTIQISRPLQDVEKTRLATEIVNSTLKVLTEVLRAQTRDIRTDVGSKATRNGRSRSKESSDSLTALNVAICASVAFALLRSAKIRGPKTVDYRIQTGISALIGKLIALNLTELAMQELCGLVTDLLTVSTSSLSNDGPLASWVLQRLFATSARKLDTQSLILIVSSQVHYLKLAEYMNEDQATVLLKNMPVSGKAGPFQLIATGLLSGLLSKTEASKSFRNLVSSLHNFVPRHQAGCGTASTAHGGVWSNMYLQFQILSFHYLVKSDKLTAHKTEYAMDLLLPLGKAIRSFVQRHDRTERSGCGEIAQTCRAIIDLCRESATCEHSEKHELLRDSLETQSSLMQLHKIADAPEKVEECFHDLQRRFQDLQLSKPDKTFTLARICLDAIDSGICYSVIGGFASELALLLREPSQVVISTDTDDILILISSIRRRVVEDIRPICTATASWPSSANFQNLEERFSLIAAISRFLTHYLTSLVKTDDVQEVPWSSQRLSMVNRIARPTIDSIFVFSNAIDKMKSTYLLEFHKALLDCAELLSSLQLVRDRGALPAIDERLAGVPLKVSDRLFAVQCRPAAKDSLMRIKLLQSSVNLLQSMPLDEKRQGRYADKLLALLREYEKKNDTRCVQQCLEQVMGFCKQSGILSRATTAFNQGGGTSDGESDYDVQTIKRILAVLHRLDPSSSLEPLLGNFSLIGRVDENEECGFLGEFQLMTMAALSNGKIDVLNIIDFASGLLSYHYKVAEFPIRRLRVITWVLQAAQIWPSSKIPPLVTACLEELAQYEPGDCAQDTQIAGQLPLLQALAQTSAAWLGDRVRQDILRAALSSWKRFLNDKHNEAFKSLLSTLPLTWYQMTSLADYFHAHRLPDQYGAIVDICEFLAQYAMCENRDDILVLKLRRCVMESEDGRTHRAQKMLRECALERPECRLTALSESEFGIVQATLAIDIGDIGAASSALRAVGNELLSAKSSPVTSHGNKSFELGLLAGAALRVFAKSRETTGAAVEALLLARASVKTLSGMWRLIHKKALISSDLVNTGRLQDQDDDCISRTGNHEIRPVAGNHIVCVNIPGLLRAAVALVDSLSSLSTCLAAMGLVREAQQYIRQAKSITQLVKLDRRHHGLKLLSATFSALESQTNKQRETFLQLLEKPDDSEFPVVETMLEVARQSLLKGDLQGAEEWLSGPITWLESRNDFTEGSGALVSSESLLSGMERLNISKKRRLASKNSKPPTAVRRHTKLPASDPSKHEAPCESRKQAHRVARQVTFLKALMVDASHKKAEPQPLVEVKHLDHPSADDQVVKAILQAKLYYEAALDDLVLHPVYNSLGDIPLCFPACRTNRMVESVQPDRQDLEEKHKRSAARAKLKPVTTTVEPKNTLAAMKSVGTLEMGAMCLKNIFEVAQTGASTALVHDLAFDLTKLSLILTKMGHNSGLGLVHELAMNSETGRRIAWYRQSCSEAAETYLSTYTDEALLENGIPGLASDSSLESPQSLQSDVLDTLPGSWTVFSLSLASSRSELQITRLRRDSPPFLVHLPLGRRLESDEEDELTFTMAKDELVDIIKLANFSSHDTTGMTRKGAKTEWWKARQALDERLKTLLQDMNRIWFGGFAGIFGQVPAAPRAFRAFRKCFEAILKNHLPSRVGRNASRHNPHIEIDDQVLGLFVGLGQPKAEGDLDEPILDLLAIVTDILQYNGESNAFDEIDFDGMIVATIDALQSYHASAAKEFPTSANTGRIILILDKHLHCFPWESMPSLQGTPISRLPSLQTLRQKLSCQRQNPDWATDREVFSIKRDIGACILNPEGDLNHTENVFRESVSELGDGWTKLIRHPPSEQELANLLETRALYLYLGHGSGGQYIRGRTVRKLGKCAVALLLGCSSATMTEAGQYESYGTPLTYLQGGSAAVVGTLWDVTDKDIDRFSLDMLRRWGLFHEESKTPRKQSNANTNKPIKGKGKPPADSKSHCVRVCLDEAVSEAREECIMRYLNGAAPVVYGLPVVLRP